MSQNHQVNLSAPQGPRIWSHPARFKILNWHRKARKTSFAVGKLINEALTHPHTYWYISPSYGAAKRTVWDDPEVLPRILPNWHTKVSKFYESNETELRIYFPSSRGSVYFVGADRPDLIRGPNPYGVVHDEFSVQRKEVWEDVTQPIIQLNPQSFAWFLFTPRGKNHAYDLVQKHQNDPDWLYSKINIYESGLYTPEYIERIRTQMSPQSFQQEMMCEFLEGEGSVFRNVKAIATALLEDPKPGHLYVMGVDLAKSQDYTVIVIYDRATNKQVYQDRFNILEWPYQKAKIATIAKRYNNALVIVDATGLGSPIADDLARSGVAIQPFHLTNQTKKDIIEKLSIAIEQRYIRIINLPETLAEFDSYEFEYTKSGLISYNARSGMHDDIVIAHALAVSELQPVYPKKAPDEMTPIQAHLRGLLGYKDPEIGLNEWANPGYEEPETW